LSRKSLKVISLYSGAGGLDLGFEAAGFDTVVAVEFDRQACATLRANRQWPVIEADIHSEAARSSEILRTADLREGEAAALIGGPPCQPFSKSGYWVRGEARRLNDPRASTLTQYLRVLRETKPEAFLLENVPGLAFSGKSEGIEFLERSIEGINKDVGTDYSFEVATLNAAEFGVPQVRQRVFVVGHRSGTSFTFPRPTHGKLTTEGAPGGGLQPFRNAWDAIGDLDDGRHDPSLAVRGKWADLLPTIPEGHNYLYHTSRGGGRPLFGWRRRYWSFLLKLAKQLPAWTIAAQPGPAIGPFHWKSRRLSVKELSRLQTFAEDFQVLGSPAEIQRQLGNAVPSALAERIALSMRAQFFGSPGLEMKELTLIPKVRHPVPPPEYIEDVPSKYLHLEGEHSDHPGTGLGFAATQRS
jgi:DNA (cytosine-5)-methyltransferase 1